MSNRNRNDVIFHPGNDDITAYSVFSTATASSRVHHSRSRECRTIDASYSSSIISFEHDVRPVSFPSVRPARLLFAVSSANVRFTSSQSSTTPFKRPLSYPYRPLDLSVFGTSWKCDDGSSGRISMHRTKTIRGKSTAANKRVTIVLRVVRCAPFVAGAIATVTHRNAKYAMAVDPCRTDDVRALTLYAV